MSKKHPAPCDVDDEQTTTFGEMLQNVGTGIKVGVLIVATLIILGIVAIIFWAKH